MTAALDKHAHEPKDPAGNHFPEDFRRRHGDPVNVLEDRIKELECGFCEIETLRRELNAMRVGSVTDQERRVAALEAALAKQNAVNKALEKWLKTRCLTKGLSEVDERVLIALHEALK